jgi:hypothetical protein
MITFSVGALLYSLTPKGIPFSLKAAKPPSVPIHLVPFSSMAIAVTLLSGKPEFALL